MNLALKSVRRLSDGVGRKKEFKDEKWVQETD
jgi:hypothetical protein